MKKTYSFHLLKLGIVSLSVLFFGIITSCSHSTATEDGSWVCNNAGNGTQIVQFKGNDVMVESTSMTNDTGNTPQIQDNRRWYTIEEKIVDDSNTNVCLYILKTNVKEGKYPKFSILGVVNIDGQTKKFHTQFLDIVRKDTKQEIIDKLNRPMFGSIGKYVAFRDILREENIFKKEAPGKH